MTNQKEIKIEKVINRNFDQLYVRQRGFGNLLNSWVDKKMLLRKNDLLCRTTYITEPLT